MCIRDSGYQLASTIGLEEANINVGGSYAYRRLWPTLDLALTRSVALHGGYRVDDESMTFHEEAIRGTAGVDLPLLRDPDASSALSVDYDFDRLRNLDGQLYDQDPN